jgi:hypothetical protein
MVLACIVNKLMYLMYYELKNCKINTAKYWGLIGDFRSFRRFRSSSSAAIFLELFLDKRAGDWKIKAVLNCICIFKHHGSRYAAGKHELSHYRR